MFNWVLAIIVFIFSLPFSLAFEWRAPTKPYRYPERTFFEIVRALFTIAILALAGFSWVILSLKVNVKYSALLMLFILPLMPLFLSFPAVPFEFFVEKENPNKGSISFIMHAHFHIFAAAIAVSFIVTYIAFVLGKVSSPNSPLPQTFQMLASNAIFDGITLITTILILSWAISKKAFLHLPIAILFDLLIAAILACSSLYFGLIFTKSELRFLEVTNVLFGRSAYGDTFDFGPYFWAMHTAFFPTLFYLLFILIYWFAKALLKPIEWFFGKGQENRNPLKLTVALFTLISVVLGFLSYCAGSFEDYLRNRPKEPNPAAAVDGAKTVHNN